MSDDQNPTLGDNHSPSVHGEQDISGSDPDPASDDDVLDSAQQVGLHVDEDPEHPQELGINKDIDQSEEHQHTH